VTSTGEDADISHLGPRAFVLIGRFDSHSESLSGSQREVWVLENCPGEAHDIGAALRNNLLRLLSLGDQASDTDDSVRKGLLDSLGKVNLEAIVSESNRCVYAEHGPDSRA
jgi:hypothetical protein